MRRGPPSSRLPRLIGVEMALYHTAPWGSRRGIDSSIYNIDKYKFMYIYLNLSIYLSTCLSILSYSKRLFLRFVCAYSYMPQFWREYAQTHDDCDLDVKIIEIEGAEHRYEEKNVLWQRRGFEASEILPRNNGKLPRSNTCEVAAKAACALLNYFCHWIGKCWTMTQWWTQSLTCFVYALCIPNWWECRLCFESSHDSRGRPSIFQESSWSSPRAEDGHEEERRRSRPSVHSDIVL